MDETTVFSDDPVAMAARWVDAGARRLHLVDLNGAFAGEPVNGEVVTAIAAAYPDLPIQIGGGIRNLFAVIGQLGNQLSGTETIVKSSRQTSA